MVEVIIFSSPTCAPCKQIKPELERQAALRGFTLRHVEMTFDNQAEFARYGVRAVPTVVCHNGEREVGRFIGAQTGAAIDGHLATWGL